MAKIITLTFNPCIDKTTTVSSLVPEKKLRCSAPQFGPGGGGINVSRAIRNLGGETTAVFPAGGYSGKFLVELVEKEGVLSQVTETRNYTRENFIVVDTSSNRQYRFGMPGNEIGEDEWMLLLKMVEGMEADYIVASGSLLPGMPEDIIGRVAKIARQGGARLVVDTSGPALKHSLDEGIFLLKPNLGELSSLVGKEEVDDAEAEAIARDIIRQGGCEIIVVSMGPYGAKLISKDHVFHVTSPVVRAVSTLGAGDSMVAGIVYRLSAGSSLKEALQYGVACGTAATITPGSELCRKSDVERLFRIISNGTPESLSQVMPKN